MAVTSPTAGQTFQTGAAIPLAATASDSDGTVAKVEFLADGVVVATDTTAPYQGSWSGAAVGDHAVSARATDDRGLAATATPVAIKVLAGPTIVASPATVSVKQGGTATFGVTLASQPSASVSVAVARTSGSTDLTATPAALTFTTANWNTPQNVTVSSAANGGDLVTAVFSATATGYAAATVTAKEISATTPPFQEAFLEQYNKIKDPASGYFRKFGDLLVPYHSVETLIVEAPDHGHQTTSEAFSYCLWLEAELRPDHAATGRRSTSAWASMEKYIIPSQGRPADQRQVQPEQARRPTRRSTPRWTQYPSQLDTSVSVGTDPIAAELKSAYGTDDIYGMHWLLDVDNTFGFGRCGDGTTAPSYINTYQRGSSESVFETIPQPSCDTFKHGGPNGYLDLFTKDASYAKQWKYTNAPDADARAVQVALLGRPVGDRAGQGRRRSRPSWRRPPRWATTCGTRCSTSTSRRSATASVRHLPRGHRQGQLALPDVLVLRLGRRDRHLGGLGVADR